MTHTHPVSKIQVQRITSELKPQRGTGTAATLYNHLQESNAAHCITNH